LLRDKWLIVFSMLDIILHNYQDLEFIFVTKSIDRQNQKPEIKMYRY